MIDIDNDIGIDGLKEVNDTFGYDVGTICSAEAHRSSATMHATTTCASVWVAEFAAATVTPGGRSADAVREADCAMYVAERERRTRKTTLTMPSSFFWKCS